LFKTQIPWQNHQNIACKKNPSYIPDAPASSKKVTESKRRTYTKEEIVEHLNANATADIDTPEIAYNDWISSAFQFTLQDADFILKNNQQASMIHLLQTYFLGTKRVLMVRCGTKSAAGGGGSAQKLYIYTGPTTKWRLMEERDYYYMLLRMSNGMTEALDNLKQEYLKRGVFCEDLEIAMSKTIQDKICSIRMDVNTPAGRVMTKFVTKHAGEYIL
jgi:hypothetical protein